MRHSLRLLLGSMLLLAVSFTALPRTAAAQASDACCIGPDNGGGTADHVPNCPVGYVGQMQMTSGFPSGSTLQLGASLQAFSGLVQIPGGLLGGMKENWTATMPLQITGTGAFAAYVRTINLPISAGESHSAPRIAFAPFQSFNTDLYQLQGQISLDPDFDLLRITAGTIFGQGSPGHTIFSQIAGGWAVDSFFNIYYRIDFVGAPGGPFAGVVGKQHGDLPVRDVPRRSVANAPKHVGRNQGSVPLERTSGSLSANTLESLYSRKFGAEGEVGFNDVDQP